MMCEWLCMQYALCFFSSVSKYVDFSVHFDCIADFSDEMFSQTNSLVRDCSRGN